MAEVTLGGVTIPTPAPYDDKKPTKQLENLCYVLLQVVQSVQSAGFKFGDIDNATKDGTDIKTAINGISLSVAPTDMTAVIQALKDLKFNDIILDFGFMRVNLTGNVVEY